MKIVKATMEKTKTDKDYVRCELDNGHQFNVFSWDDRFDEFAPLVDSGKQKAIEKDELYMKDQYVNLRPSDGEIPDGGKPVDFSALDEKIDKQMSRKEYSIKMASTISMATNVVTAMIEADAVDPVNDRNVQRKILEWRHFFNDQWEHIEGNAPLPDELLGDN